MKTIFILLIAAISLVSCSSDDTTIEEEIIEGAVEGGTVEMNIYGNSKIVVPVNSEFFVTTIASGDNLVFEYTLSIAPDPELQDSGFYETVVFEIAPGAREFSVSDDDLQFIKSYYRHVCFCEITESIEIDSGVISGIKIDATSWEINIDVNVRIYEEGPLVNKKVSGNFVLD